MDLVSIIIPTYKGSNVICRAVDSVINQNYSNIEIIVVDDNGLGTDEQKKTAVAMQKYMNDSRVRYIVHEKNCNGSVARNTGIKAANGNYIALLDDDDEFLPNKISKQIEVLKNLSEDWGMVYCSFYLVEDRGRQKIINATHSGYILTDFFKGKIYIASSLIMFRHSIIDSVGYFDEDFKRHQDWEFIARVAQRYKIKAIDQPLVKKYIIRRNSPKDARAFRDYRLFYLEKMKNIISELNLDEQRSIYDHHYKEIAKAFLKDGEFKATINWLRKTSQPTKSALGLLIDAIKYIGGQIMTK